MMILFCIPFFKARGSVMGGGIRYIHTVYINLLMKSFSIKTQGKKASVCLCGVWLVEPLCPCRERMYWVIRLQYRNHKLLLSWSQRRPLDMETLISSQRGAAHQTERAWTVTTGQEGHYTLRLLLVFSLFQIITCIYCIFKWLSYLSLSCDVFPTATPRRKRPSWGYLMGFFRNYPHF